MPAFLQGRIDYERVTIPKQAEYFKLARMRELLAAIGNPQDQLNIIHIAGTKGKGSTAAMVAAILGEVGCRTGLYTSPHIHQVEERLVAEGRQITAEDFARIIEILRPDVERLDEIDQSRDIPLGGPTFFEIVNATALYWFAEQKLDAAVMEVGLGGRLDSTNVCHPKVTIITSIGLDHTKQLGSTLAQIAIEKAGIIKPGIPCITSVSVAEPLREIRRVASEQQAPLFEVGADFQFSYAPASEAIPFQPGTIDYTDQFGEKPFSIKTIPLPMPGAHQAVNAAVAIAATRFFLSKKAPVSENAISPDAVLRGIPKGKAPARLEVVQRHPTILVDAAHNEPSVRALIEALLPEKPKFRQRVALISISRDKAIDPMLELLVPHFDRIICTRFIANPRACDPTELADAVVRAGNKLALNKLPRVDVFDQPETAWEATRPDLGKQDLLCVAGSFFIAAEMLEQIQRRPTLPV